MDDIDNIPSGRLGRLAKVAGLAAKTATGLALGRARRALGDETRSVEKHAAEKVLETLGTLKGAAMKLGQQLAMEADQLPPEARELVARLFAQAPPMTFEKIAQVIQEELGPPQERFATFEREPIAAASLGQVHRATLPDGTPVAVKVQYPGVAEALLADLANAELLVRGARGASRAIAFDPAPYYAELRQEIGAEVDYLRESRLGTEYAEAVKDIGELHVPRVHPEFTTGRVLTMEYAEGVPLQAFVASNPSPEERWRVGRQLVIAVLGPFLDNRLVHADPHPGNFLVRPDGRLTVLDFGAVKRLSSAFAGNFWGLMEAELRGESPDILGILERSGFSLSGDLEKTGRAMERLHAIAARPAMAEEYDWARCRIVPDMRRTVATHVRELSRIRPPPESVMFYRALLGVANNLRMLQSRGPYRQLLRELSRIEPAPPRRHLPE